MLTLLAGLLLISPQEVELEPAPPTPYDQVIELEITANDPELIGGRGATAVVEYEVGFEGTLHVWTRSEFDLFLQVDDVLAGRPLGSDDDSGGGTTPYVRLEVREGNRLAVLVAGHPGVVGALNLHLIAAPESDITRAAARATDEALEEVARLKAAGKLGAARELLDRSLGALHAAMGAESSALVTDASWDLAVTAYALDSPQSARSGWSWALNHRIRTMPRDHPDLQVARVDVAITLEDMGDFVGARRLLEQAVEVFSRTLPPDHRDLQVTRANLAITIKALGDLAGACELQTQILEVYSRTLPKDHPDLQLARLWLANTIRDQGNLAGARELQEQILEVFSRTLPEDHRNLQAARANLAGTLFALGDLAGARQLHEHVLEVYSRTLPEDHTDLQAARANVALTIGKLGDLDGARELHEQVLKVFSRTLPPDHPYLQAARGNLAGSLGALGDLEGARELEEQALEVYSRTLPDGHPHLQRTRGNLANTIRRLGDLESACELQEQVLEVFSNTLPPDHTHIQVSRLSLATTIKGLGDLEGARELEEQALEVYSRTMPEDHPYLQATRANLGRTRAALGDLAGARELASSLLASVRRRAADLHEESPRAARAGGRQQLGLVFQALPLSDSSDGLQALTQELFAALESLRNVSVASPRVALAIAESAELAGTQQEVVRLRAEINDLASLGPDEGVSIEVWRDELVRLTTGRDRLQRELRVSLAKTGILLDEIDAPSIASALLSNSAAVTFLQHARQSRPDPETGEQLPAIDSLLAFFVRADGTVGRIELGPAEEIEELVYQWRAAVGKPLATRGVGSLSEEKLNRSNIAALGEDLRARILDPVLGRVGGARALHVVPDSSLHLLPIDCLPLDDGLVGDRLTIHLEVSLGTLVQQPRPSGEASDLVLVGDVDYGAEIGSETDPRLDAGTPPLHVSRAGTLEEGFGGLPGTAEEVNAINALFAGTKEPVILVGSSATKAALVVRAPSARYLHIATHGWFAPEFFRSQVDRDPNEDHGLALRRAEEAVRGFAPETLCGLALAGANNGRDELGRVPGIITAEELSTLDLRNCELAVLSACETNVGIRRAGQGIQSLQTALHAAGARTAITSLWKVDDAATRRLFELFYTKLWKEKLGKADALWQAKMALRSEGHPVRDWAGWVLTGDPE
jgi:CHAT domain-containing protein/tetratricopeptide (TPR) repeat protein